MTKGKALLPAAIYLSNIHASPLAAFDVQFERGLAHVPDVLANRFLLTKPIDCWRFHDREGATTDEMGKRRHLARYFKRAFYAALASVVHRKRA